jgi:hypothetical protein
MASPPPPEEDLPGGGLGAWGRVVQARPPYGPLLPGTPMQPALPHSASPMPPRVYPRTALGVGAGGSGLNRAGALQEVPLLVLERQDWGGLERAAGEGVEGVALVEGEEAMGPEEGGLRYNRAQSSVSRIQEARASSV